MIISANRFHGYNALRHVYGRGQTVRGPHISLKYMLNNRRATFRAAVVVSRKVHKSAVVRNRIRRRIYEIIRLQQPKMAANYDIVVTVFSEQLASLPAVELQAMVVQQFEKAGIVSYHRATQINAIVDAEERS